MSYSDPMGNLSLNPRQYQGNQMKRRLKGSEDSERLYKMALLGEAFVARASAYSRYTYYLETTGLHRHIGTRMPHVGSRPNKRRIPTTLWFEGSFMWSSAPYLE